MVLEDGTLESPVGFAMWAYAWQRTRVGLGVAVGQFPFRTSGGDLIDLPAYPIVDVWIRL